MKQRLMNSIFWLAYVLALAAGVEAALAAWCGRGIFQVYFMHQKEKAVDTFYFEGKTK